MMKFLTKSASFMGNGMIPSCTIDLGFSLLWLTDSRLIHDLQCDWFINDFSMIYWSNQSDVLYSIFFNQVFIFPPEIMLCRFEALIPRNTSNIAITRLMHTLRMPFSQIYNAVYSLALSLECHSRNSTSVRGSFFHTSYSPCFYIRPTSSQRQLNQPIGILSHHETPIQWTADSIPRHGGGPLRIGTVAWVCRLLKMWRRLC